MDLLPLREGTLRVCLAASVRVETNLGKGFLYVWNYYTRLETIRSARETQDYVHPTQKVPVKYPEGK